MSVSKITHWLTDLPRLTEGKKFYIVLGALLLIGLVLRTLYLDADPPAGITRSQDFSTDPFAYTMFAKNKVDLGNANPFNDQRWILYERSTQTIAALLVYSVAGTGRAEGNFVAVLLNMLAITFVALGMKNFGSRLGAIGFATIASVSYIFVFFGRTPFLEASQNFWLSAAFYLFSLGGRSNLMFAFSGAATAAAAFFGKMLALGTGGLYLATFLTLFFANPVERKLTVRRGLHFGGGYLAIALFWLLFSYLPHTKEVASYLHEQGLGLYGAPRGFQDLQSFLWQLHSLLWESEFVRKLPLVFLLGGIFSAVVLSAVQRSLRDKRLVPTVSVGSILLFFWFVFGFLTLFPWNYRPLRYQTVLMFPLMAMAALMLASPWEWSRGKVKQEKKKDSGSRTVYAALLCGLWLMPLIGTAFLQLTDWSGSEKARSSIQASVYIYSILFLGVGVALTFGTRFFSGVRTNWRKIGQYTALPVLVTLLVVSLWQFADWVRTRQYSLITADRDLTAILNNGAVLSGSYAVALTQENKLPYVHHMFVMKCDPDFFRTYPITHLVMDEGNDKQARSDYPEVMSRANLITRYMIRGFPVRLYRVSGVTQNAQARQYVPSDFERAQAFISERNNDSAVVYMQRFLSSSTPNYSANLYAADALYSQNKFAEALDFYRKVQQFSPGDGLSAFNLANCFMATETPGGKGGNLDSALAYYKIARNLYSQDKNLAETIKGLEKRKR